MQLLLISLLGIEVAQADPEPGRLYRLLILDSQSGSPYEEIRHAFLDALAEYGYRTGVNLQLTLHSSGNDTRQGALLLREEASRSRYDVVYVGGTTATLSAKQVYYGGQQAVVFAGATDPVGIGVIDAFDQPPKANFTGVCYPVPVEARLRFIRHLLPEAHRFGLIYADMPQSRSYNTWIRQTLDQDPRFEGMQVIFQAVPLITSDEGDRTMAALASPLVEALDSQVDAFIAPNDQLGARRAFSELFPQHASKPLIGLVRSDVMEGWGALASIFPRHESIGRMAAGMVRDLFEGKAVSEIEPRRPSRFGYAVNLERAQAYGVAIPIGILQLAGENIRR